MTRPYLLALVLLSLIAVAGCDGGLRGTYAARGRASFDVLTFTSRHTVELTVGGRSTAATYAIDGPRLTIQVGDITEVLTVVGSSCLDGGGLFGTYCQPLRRDAPREVKGTGGPLTGFHRGLRNGK